MARVRIFTVLLLAVGLGGTFAFGTYQYIQNIPAKEITLPTNPVVVAAHDLSLGAALKRVDVIATVSPTQQQTDMTSKVVLTNVLVLAAGTRIEQDAEQKPISVSVVTLLVDPVEAERLTLASTEGKIQLALRHPLDKTAPATPGIRPAILLGQSAAASRPAVAVARTARAA